MSTVDILLATYNGARFLPEQLASLEAQTYEGWRIIVRDDGSSDGSLDIVVDWARQNVRSIVVIEDGETRIGPAESFTRLLARSDAPYFAFCDQDDVWRANKIERLVTDMRSLEAAHGNDLPMLVHSNLSVVGGDLTPTGQSFWQHSKIKNVDVGALEGNSSLRRGLLLQNVVTGCAMLGNAELRRRAMPIPAGVYMHDWWVTLVAAYFGVVRGVPELLVDYRQHSSNTVGAKAWDPVSVLQRFLAQPLGTTRRTRERLTQFQSQARCFVEQFGGHLSDEDRRILSEFASLPQRSFLERKKFMMRHGVYPQSRLRGLILLSVI